MRDAASALPLPQAEPERVSALADRLALIAGRLGEPALARAGGPLPVLGVAWSGPAAEAARAEAAELARLAASTATRLPPAVSALHGYAASLAAARAAIRALQTEWESIERIRAATVLHPLLDPAGAVAVPGDGEVAVADAALGRLHVRHAAIIDELAAAAGRAAAVLRSCAAPLDEAGSATGAALSGLPLTAGDRQWTAAAHRLATVIAGVGRPVEQWTAQDLIRVVSELGDQLRDPVMAQQLFGALGATAVTRLLGSAAVVAASGVDAPWGAGWAGFEAALGPLGLAFGLAAAGLTDTARDPGTIGRLSATRQGWLAQLASDGRAAVMVPGTRVTITGFEALGLLLWAARSVGAPSPGADFVRRVGVPMVRAEAATAAALRTGSAPVRPPELGVPLPPDGAADPVTALVAVARSDPAAARTLLLERLDSERTVLDYLVIDRPGPPPPELPAVVRVAASGSDPQAAEVRVAFLDAFGRAAELNAGPGRIERIAADRHLQPLRYAAAELLAASPGLVWEALAADEASAMPSTGALYAAGEPPGPDRPPRLPGQDRLAAIVGDLAKDGLGADAAGGSVRTPALGLVLDSLTAFESRRVAAALGPAGSAGAADASVVRLGQSVGFVVEAAATALVTQAELTDASQYRDRVGARLLVDAVPLPSVLTEQPLGRVVVVAGEFARSLVVAEIERAHPVDHRDRTVSALAAERLHGDQQLRSLARHLLIAAGVTDRTDPRHTTLPADLVVAVHEGMLRVSPPVREPSPTP